MNSFIAPKHHTTHRSLSIACATTLAVACTVSLAQPAHREKITVPAVPFNIEVPAGNHVFLLGHGVGTQNYECQPVGDGVKYVLFTPQATLFSDDDKELITHFFSPNPEKVNTDPTVVADGVISVTWQHARDTSTVWGLVLKDENGLPESSTDEKFVARDAVAWLKVTKTGVEEGPTGGDTLTKTTFIQRLNTAGGLAPSTGCVSPTDLGHKAFVPYTADYFFYTDQ